MIAAGAAKRLLAELPVAARIHVPAATGEAAAIGSLLAPAFAQLVGPRFFASLVPGLNAFDYSALAPQASLTTLLLPPALREGHGRGAVRLWPVSYLSAARALAGGDPFDLAIAHASLPRGEGLCSLSLSADFTPLTWRRAKRRLLLVNPDLPFVAGAPRLDPRDADLTIEIDGAAPELSVAAASVEADIAARHAAAFVQDGNTIQLGIGQIPDRAVYMLRDRRSLRVHSGAIGDGMVALAESGALCGSRVHRAGAAVGTRKLHDFLSTEDRFEMVDTLRSHAPERIAEHPGFVSINSALEVDLFGQVNLEWRQGRIVSGVGGAPDFQSGARLAPGGRAIIALAATAAGGSVTRIVPRLTGPAVSLPRYLADTVVTEFGAAELADRDMDSRAEAVIAIAAPPHRDMLAEAWREMRGKM